MCLSVPRRLALLLFFVGGLPALANAQLIPGYSDNVLDHDPREIALIPRYCKFTQIFRERVPGGNDRAEQARWYATLGPTFHDLHHYCWGLMKTNRAVFLARSNSVRDFYLNDAIIEFDYVLKRAPRDFLLLPELLARKGDVRLRLGQLPLGLELMEESISLKPDYWLPYALTSDYYKSVGDVERARQWLLDGLKREPESPPLKSRLEALEQRAPRKTGD
jgi:tetratricopeptide (TPR) repeat protein